VRTTCFTLEKLAQTGKKSVRWLPMTIYSLGTRTLLFYMWTPITLRGTEQALPPSTHFSVSLDNQKKTPAAFQNTAFPTLHEHFKYHSTSSWRVPGAPHI